MFIFNNTNIIITIISKFVLTTTPAPMMAAIRRAAVPSSPMRRFAMMEACVQRVTNAFRDNAMGTWCPVTMATSAQTMAVTRKPDVSTRTWIHLVKTAICARSMTVAREDSASVEIRRSAMTVMAAPRSTATWALAIATTRTTTIPVMTAMYVRMATRVCSGFARAPRA